MSLSAVCHIVMKPPGILLRIGSRSPLKRTRVPRGRDRVFHGNARMWRCIAGGIRLYGYKDLPEEDVYRTEELRLHIEAFHKLYQKISGCRTIFFQLGRIEDQDWHTAWPQALADQATPELLIVPAWEPVPLIQRAGPLRMDQARPSEPGAPTTRMCLQALEATWRPGDRSVFWTWEPEAEFWQCGVLLGASPVVSDVDEEALRWAQWNLDLNR